jgi:hypothetical protein
MGRLVVLFVAVLVATELFAEVRVVPVFVTDPDRRQVDIPAGRSLIVPLPGGNQGDRYQVQVDLGNQVYRDISAYIVDSENLARFQRRERFIADGQPKAVAPFTLQHTANLAGARYLVLDNTYAMVIAKKATITTRMARAMSQEETRQMREGIEKTYDALKRIFVFQDFDIDVKPCGMANAYSERATGNITLCTEMLHKAAGKSGASLGILMHELGHTLLGLWRLPGADNEDMADEFAVQMLMRMKDGSRYVREFAEYFAGGNPWLHAKTIIQQGDRHTLSPQRIRNLSGWAQNAADLLPRWNRLLYPNMTNDALRAIVARQSSADDSGLARDELSRRGLAPN